ncbi:unnamed protein product [Caenorhabditis sp. 36 PRJEB53466]|nr:unnamed protein product [Caenorhabditis sp. 36 PRJEB53466]
MRTILISVLIFLKIGQVTSQTTLIEILDFPRGNCPSVQQCQCVDESRERIQCHSPDESNIRELERVYGAEVRHLEIWSWQSYSLNFDIFANFSRLETLLLQDSELETLNATLIHESVRILWLRNSEISSDSEVCHVIAHLPALQNLSLSRNYLEKFDCDGTETKLSILDLSRNLISHVELPESVKNLDISGNRLTSIQNISTDLTHLDISYNRISSWPESPEDVKFPNLKHLSAAKMSVKTGFHLEAPLLESMNIDETALEFLDFHRLKMPKIKRISARNLIELRHISGNLPSAVKNVAITETQLRTLPANFFPSSVYPKSPLAAAPNRPTVSFSSKNILCEPCLLQWSLPVFEQSGVGQLCNLTRPEIALSECRVGVKWNGTGIEYGKYERPTALSCFAYGSPAPRITWFRYRPSEKLGTYDPQTDSIDYSNVSAEMRESYSIQSGGSLLIHSPNRSHVERYVCVVENAHGKEYGIYLFRLDYLDWYGYDVFHSVFWGGLACSLIVCLISFLLNITWILTRKSALWWIQRAERLSRVRKMVEAMEKYRVRQMESLHEKYTKRVQIVRDNYHQQVEALRVSYAAQHEKFQNYRAAQVDAVHSHLDAMRDGYNNQLGRVREYGSKRAEQLWESYERQVNRMRTFSLQHRLKMMRQYKVKQRYVNKLLESFQAGSSEVDLENEEKVRAALEIPDDLATIDGGLDTPSRLSRSSSFHSLPEYVIDEQGNVRPGIIPSSTASIRFSTSKPSSSTSGAGPSSPRRSGAPPAKRPFPESPED